MNRYRPSYEEFARFLGTASCIPVYRQLTGDGLTPVSAFGRIARSAPSFLFESVIGGEKVGRFSFLGTEPFLRFEARGNDVTITATEKPKSPRRFTSPDPFRELQDLVERYRAVPLRGLPRFAGGAVGYASYDAVRYTESLPAMPPDDRGLPDLSFAFYDRMVLFDHIARQSWWSPRLMLGQNPIPGQPTKRHATGSTNWSIVWPRRALTWGCVISTRNRPLRSSRGRISVARNMKRSYVIARNT
jgi:hypothetical protein